MINKILIALFICFFLLGVSFAATEPADPSSLDVLGTTGKVTPEDAIAFFESAVSVNPDNFVALTALADLYAHARGDIHKAIKLYEKAIQINDKYDFAHLGLGFAYIGLQMNDDAKHEFKTVLKVSDRDFVKQVARDYLNALGK